MRIILAILALFGIYYFGKQCFPCNEGEEQHAFTKGAALTDLFKGAKQGSGVNVWQGGPPVSIVSNPPTLYPVSAPAPAPKPTSTGLRFGTAPITYGGGFFGG